MKPGKAPPFEQRRAADFAAELRQRATAWIPSWDVAQGAGDFGRALLEVAARFSSEVAEVLDGAGEKTRRGFLDWLGIRGKAARPARMPVVFKLADGAKEPVMASAPVRLQADADGAPVIFETEGDVRILPARVAIVVGTDAGQDAIYLPPPGLSDLTPLEPTPSQWRVKSFAAAGGATLQLDPEIGITVDMILEAAGKQYKVVKVDKDLVTIEPALEAGLDDDAVVAKVGSFSAFDDGARNWQEHVLYLGDSELLNVEAAATLEVLGAGALPEVARWEYWGKADAGDKVDWQPLKIVDQGTSTSGAVVLSKPKGALEQLEIKGHNARWIRAFVQTLAPDAEPFKAESFAIRINSSGCRKDTPCPPDSETNSPAAEGMANTTPLVLNNLFFPLGKEPRQFDAFYLGSREALSKAGGEVQLCFEMADRSFVSLSALRTGQGRAVLAGVAKDRSLHLLAFDSGAISKYRNRGPLQPPQPSYQNKTEPGESTIPLDKQQPRWRLPMWAEGDGGLSVAVPIADAVWVWRESPGETPPLNEQSGWVDFGKLPSAEVVDDSPVDGLAHLGGVSQIAGLRSGRLFLRAWPSGAAWVPVDTTDGGGNAIRLTSIVPVLVADGSGRFNTSGSIDLVGIDDHQKLFHVSTGGLCIPVLQPTNVLESVQPVAMNLSGKLFVAAVSDASPSKLVAHLDTVVPNDVTLDASVVVALEAVLVESALHVIAVIRDGTARRVVTWSPFTTQPPARTTGNAAMLFTSPVSGDRGLPEGAPTAIDQYIVVPGAQADILINQFDPMSRVIKSATVETGIVVPDSTPALAPGDLVVRSVGGHPEVRTVAQPGISRGGEVFYPIDVNFSGGATGPLLAYKLPSMLSGSFALPDVWTLDPNDHETAPGSWVRIGSYFFEAGPVDRTVNPPVTTISVLDGPLPADGTSDTYVPSFSTGGRVAPFMRLDPAGNGNWAVELLSRVPIIFPGKTPREQRATAFSTVGGKPVVVVLEVEFQDSLAVPFEFLLDGALGDWHRDLGDTSTNPELSWEYWNGKGWWRLNVTRDETRYLKSTGRISFTIPDDIALSDWAGKTNYWIRARLIGGDYGREKVTVKIKPLPKGESEQTVERSSENIHAPSVLKLYISYRVCTPVLPAFVLTKDSGSIRNQSDANRTAGARVEAFVPLAVALDRLSKGVVASESPENGCAPQCRCHDPEAVMTGGAAVPPLPERTPPSATGRSLFIGVSGPLSGASVNLMMLVQEHPHTPFAPMSIDAIVADRFVPIVAADATRALGESGLLSIAFDVTPTPRELFGQTEPELSWLRLTPKAVLNAEDWKPSLRGVYLNAAWTTATETLTRELLGSSDGAPNLVVTLARPPLLHGTLELRVKEPLGEEERKALLQKGKDRVQSSVQDLPGDWVLWDQVIDPLDEAAGARVYSLDEATGEIRFGDGLHGLIPPIGRDSIVAFRYQRTEPGAPGTDSVPGNSIAPRTVLNLVSPLEAVETVFAADQAAGGAPTEPDDRVLRYGFARLRHRERGITAQDLEDLTLQSSPEFAQARADFQRGDVRLVVVMRGPNPRPTSAQVRELRRLLLTSTPVSLGATNALRIDGPRVRRLRIELHLGVETLEHAGALAEFVKDRLSRLFDTATGGADNDGWPLGANPTGEDIAFALVDAPYLQSIIDVGLHEALDGGGEQPWPRALLPTEIAMLAEDPIRIRFETGEVSP